MSLYDGRRHLLGRQLLCTSLILIGSAAAHAGPDAADSDADTDQTTGRSLDPVLVTAQALHGPQTAPSQGSLVATQPQSIVSGDFIHSNDAPTANYTDIIKITPSVWTVDPNGPGLAKWPVYSAADGWPVMFLDAPQPTARKDDQRARYLFLAGAWAK